MSDMMPNSTILRYMSIFEYVTFFILYFNVLYTYETFENLNGSFCRHPWDVDLWSGGVAENPLPGSMVGPTFACIIATQMSLLRRGDRFWYELPNQPSSFTPGLFYIVLFSTLLTEIWLNYIYRIILLYFRLAFSYP